MNAKMTGRARGIAALVPSAAALLLAGCGAQTPPPKLETIVVPLPQNVVVEPPPVLPVEPVPPELVYASRGEDLWHLRAALNVAALICDPKVKASLVPSYNRMLTVHKALLTAAVQSELDQFKAVDKKKWQALYDTHMTKIYNQYSITPQRARFCDKATEFANKAADLSAEAFSDQATAMIFRLNLAGEINQAVVVAVTPASQPLVTQPLASKP